ncbi:MAG: redoxin domain-containing protein [Acidimicrobiia bacterium]
MATVIYGGLESDVSGAISDGQDLWLPLGDLKPAAGWELRPEGVCAGTTCVPVPPGGEGAWERDGSFNLSAFAAHLGQPVATDDEHDVWVFADAPGERVGPGAEAPEFTLPDLDDTLHRLSDYRGRKVMLMAWASW